jgi:N-acetylmuramoyl-L-alanine amidase
MGCMRRVVSLVLFAGLLASMGAAVAVQPVPPTNTRPAARPQATGAGAGAAGAPGKPLAGKVVVVDPGHQLGNHNYPRQINRLVPSGDGRKPCNTTGTSTNGGYPEATFTWQVARRVRARLLWLGAKVIMTRHSNRQDRWGPCVNVRGRTGNGRADLEVSIHGDGTYAAGARGFHVIYASNVKPTRDTFRASRRYAVSTRNMLTKAGFKRSTYVGGGTALDMRHDLATLNLSSKPTCLVELGNMRNAADARLMTSPRARHRYALALVAGMRAYLHR